MPYITNKSHRKILDSMIEKYRLLLGQNGHLNYFLYKLAKENCNNYATYKEFLGELEAAKLEIYRRQIAVYEDKKIKENGDVE